MCGISGIVDFSAAAPDPGLQDTARRMRDSLRHRGPDDEGLWHDSQRRVWLGHTRLAVVDLLSTGHQPMLSGDARHVLTFNGEIYNHRDLRARLEAEGCGFRGHSDTEVLLQAILSWGWERALREAVGMFALAMWDTVSRTLTLARDRFGKKPLYLARRDRTLVFGSELRALLCWPGLRPRIHERAARSMLRLGYVGGGRSILEGVCPLAPGHWLSLDAGSMDAPLRARQFWQLSDDLRQERARDAPQQAAALRRVSDALERAVRERMVADVPLGALLSGGIDSSLVVALMQRASHERVRTFSVGFEDGDFDESGFAARVAGHLGTDHTRLLLRPRDALEAVKELPAVYDEPFADSSQLPTLLISRLTRAHVTVALTGDGGDEMFGGYNRHIQAAALERYLATVPRRARESLARAVCRVPPGWLDRVAALLRASAVGQSAGDRAHKLARLSAARDSLDLYHRCLLSSDLDPCRAGEPATCWLPDLPPGSDDMDLASRFMAADCLGYLASDILVKVDRAGMSCALELRSPFLDHRVCTAAWALAPGQRIQHGRGKQVLRALLARHLPMTLFERPKAGFAVPLAGWLRGALREWAEELLSPADLAEDEYIDAAVVRRAWASHLGERANMQHFLWPVLMFRAWRRHWAL